jgi:hypothetical protein
MHVSIVGYITCNSKYSNVCKSVYVLIYIHAGGREFKLDNDQYNHVYDNSENEANNEASDDEEYDAFQDEDDTTHNSTSHAAVPKNKY